MAIEIMVTLSDKKNKEARGWIYHAMHFNSGLKKCKEFPFLLTKHVDALYLKPSCWDLVFLVFKYFYNNKESVGCQDFIYFWIAIIGHRNQGNP